jgi:UDP-N-acetyl-D-galactosamine dehydrogenase
VFENSEVNIAILGLGYVGLPLAIEFSKVFDVIGFDLDPARIRQLEINIDSSGEQSEHEFLEAKSLRYTSDVDELKEANFFIVCVPTPIDGDNAPDLESITNATQTVAQNLKKGDVVVFESTVYPG